MKEVKRFIAEDGQEFKNNADCKKHEENYVDMIKKQYGTMYDLRQSIGGYAYVTIEDYGKYGDEFIEIVKDWRKLKERIENWIK